MNNISKILFVPVCSKCEKILKQRVDYETVETPDNKMTFYEKRIVPEQCPFCGARFDRIVMPQALPQLFDWII